MHYLKLRYSTGESNSIVGSFGVGCVSKFLSLYNIILKTPDIPTIPGNFLTPHSTPTHPHKKTSTRLRFYLPTFLPTDRFSYFPTPFKYRYNHIEKRSRVRISGPEELAGVWKEFLAAKFTPTELEKTRSALEELSESKDEKIKSQEKNSMMLLTA